MHSHSLSTTGLRRHQHWQTIPGPITAYRQQEERSSLHIPVSGYTTQIPPESNARLTHLYAGVCTQV